MKINVWWVVALAVVLFAVMRSCEKKPGIVTVTTTEVNIEKIKDSIRNVVLKSVKPIYIDTSKTKIKWLKGETKTVYRDTTIYKNKPSQNTIESNEYKVRLESNEATTDLTIIADNLYHFEGVTTFPKVTKTIKETTTITRDNSGLYIYGNLPVSNLSSPEVGALFQIKNKLFISGGLQYNNLSKQLDYKVGLGIRIF